MAINNPITKTSIPSSLKPAFKEYDLFALDLHLDANLIIQRTLEFGNWNEIRWLFQTYRVPRIQRYVRRYGERGLDPKTFNYWRKLLGIRRWHRASFPLNELWNP